MDACLANDFGGKFLLPDSPASSCRSTSIRKISKTRPPTKQSRLPKTKPNGSRNGYPGQIEENLSLAEEESEWNWEALCQFRQRPLGPQFRDRDLKKLGRDRVDELLIDKAASRDPENRNQRGEPMLEPDYGLRTALDVDQSKIWFRSRFRYRSKRLFQPGNHGLRDRTGGETYHEKEAVYPVMAGLYQFVVSSGGGAQATNRSGRLGRWASRRFESELSRWTI